MSNKVKHDLENELLRLKSIIAFVFNDNSPFEKGELFTDGNESIENIKKLFNELSRESDARAN